MVLLFAKGLVIGLAVAAPAGPVAILCIRQVLLQGWLAGLALGFGSSLADTVFGAIAGFGIAALSDLLIAHDVWLRAGGGAFMLALGIRSWLSCHDRARPPISGRLLQDFFSAFILTIVNPMTVLAFTALYAAFGIVSHETTLAASVWLILGVALGAMMWWSCLSLIVTLFSSRVVERNFIWLHRLSGGLLLAFASLALGSLMFV